VTLVVTVETELNAMNVESVPSGSTEPRFPAPAVSERVNSRYVVASVDSVHRILTEFASGVSGNTYEIVGFRVPIFQELPLVGETNVGGCVDDETQATDPVT
jgi:hypothetical protein